MASRASKKRAYRAQHPKQEKPKPVHPEKEVWAFSHVKFSLRTRIRLFLSDCLRYIKDLFQDVKDMVCPPKRCNLKLYGKGRLAGVYPIKIYRCTECSSECWTTDLSPQGKHDLIAHSRCNSDKNRT